MTPAEERLYKFSKIDVSELIFEISSEKDTQKYIIDILQNQLFSTGQDGLGQSLGEYSPVTIRIKKAKGDPTDRITLFDTGEFYDSYYIEPFKGGFIISADPIKIDSSGEKTNLFVKYGDEILLPNQESIILIRDWYRTKVIEYISKILLS